MPPNLWLLQNTIRFVFFFLQTFVLVINLRTIRISLCNELIYLCIFITYMRRFTPSSIPRSLH